LHLASHLSSSSFTPLFRLHYSELIVAISAADSSEEAEDGVDDGLGSLRHGF